MNTFSTDSNGFLLLATRCRLHAPQVDFDAEIQPMLEERCWYCHGEHEQESALRLDRRANMLQGGDYGLPTIVPGKPEKSYLIDVAKHLHPDLEMPPDKDEIPAKEIELLDGPGLRTTNLLPQRTGKTTDQCPRACAARPAGLTPRQPLYECRATGASLSGS